MRGVRRSVLVLATVCSLGLAGCSAQRHPLGSAEGLTLPSPEPSPGACTITDRQLISKTFGVQAAQSGREKKEPFLSTGTELTCEFKASQWTLTVERATFTSTASPAGVLNSTMFKDDPDAKRIYGVGDAAGYSERLSSIAEFVAIDKTEGDRGVLVLLIGTRDSDSESDMTALAKQLLDNAPK
jgi:hypothetical protein